MKKEMRCSREECKTYEAPFPHRLWDEKRGGFSGPKCKGPGEEVDIPYADWTFEALAEKIDAEGFDYFFTDWIDMYAIHDEQLEHLVISYRLAAKELENYLRSKGGLL